MSDSRSSQLTTQRSHLPRKLVIVFLLAIDAALGLLYLFQQKPAAPVLGRTLLIDLGLGLAAGVGARLTLGERHWFVRFVAGMAALIAGLATLGILSHWRLGIGPLQFWRADVDWFDLAQLSLGMIPVILTISAWIRPATANAGIGVSSPPQVEPVARASASAFVVEPRAAPLVVEPVPHRPEPKRGRKTSPPSSRVHPRTRPLKAKAAPALSIKAPAAHPKRRSFGRRPQMHFSKQEKHLCPYCLEPVERNDPRGVVECKICHALHHADCWEITGTCQVPHYNA